MLMIVQAVPQSYVKRSEHGGEYPDRQLQALIDQVGWRLIKANPDILKTHPWEFEFTLLRDPQTVNAFALPGGQTFITYALFSQLNAQLAAAGEAQLDEAQLAGVLGHEIAHAVARHGAQRMAKDGFKRGLIGAVVAASGSPEIGRVAEVVGCMVGMKYGRDDELESDRLGMLFMANATHDPRPTTHDPRPTTHDPRPTTHDPRPTTHDPRPTTHDPRPTSGVMEVLKKAGEGKAPPEFFSTHPNSVGRMEKIQEAIDELFPNDLQRN
ncbi:MAG: putative Zn-dependent protease [Verrucomicrobiales bacterium]